MAATPSDDPVIDLLGLLAYAELSGFERLAEDASLAPDLGDKARLAELAGAELRHFVRLRSELEARGAAPAEAMAPFVPAIDEFHRRTRPSDWLEGVVKAYVGDGIAVDFYREVALLVDAETRAAVLVVLDDTGHSSFAVDAVNRAIAADPLVAGRLALWGRRIVGEALAQAQHVVAERDALLGLLAGGAGAAGGFDTVARMFSRISEHHSRRMAALGLAS